MNTSLDHLPERKRQQLRAIAAAVQAKVNVEMIILFGSYARGNWVEDHCTLYYSDYDLMVIVESPEVAQDHLLWQRLTAELRQIAGHVRFWMYFNDVGLRLVMPKWNALRRVATKPRLHDGGKWLGPRGRVTSWLRCRNAPSSGALASTGASRNGGKPIEWNAD